MPLILLPSEVHKLLTGPAQHRGLTQLQDAGRPPLDTSTVSLTIPSPTSPSYYWSQQETSLWVRSLQPSAQPRSQEAGAWEVLCRSASFRLGKLKQVIAGKWFLKVLTIYEDSNSNNLTK